MFSAKSPQLVRIMARRQHPLASHMVGHLRHHPRKSNGMIYPKRLSSVFGGGDHRRFTMCGKKMSATTASSRGRTKNNINGRLKAVTMGKRFSTNEAGNPAAISSEETAQQLNQLLQQPLALEAFITKELTSSQRQAIQRLLEKPDIGTVEVPQPSMASLRLVAINTSIPFVGFGIMDNAM